MQSDTNFAKVFVNKNKLIFTALMEVCAFVVSYNLYVTASNTLTVANVVVVLLPLLYLFLSKNALAVAYFDSVGVTVKKFNKVIATHEWDSSEVGVYTKKNGRKYDYYIYVSRPHPTLTASDYRHIVPFTINDESVLAFVTYYGGEYVGYEVLTERHVEIFDRAKRTIHTVVERSQERDKQSAHTLTEQERKRAKKRKSKQK